MYLWMPRVTSWQENKKRVGSRHYGSCRACYSLMCVSREDASLKPEFNEIPTLKDSPKSLFPIIVQLQMLVANSMFHKDH